MSAQEPRALESVEDTARTPSGLMTRSQQIAHVCREIVSATATVIQGRKFVCVEGWQAIATAHGCVLSAEDLVREEGGVQARAAVRRMDTGAVIATGYGYVGDDERTWGARPEYAKRAMAQTRAMSRAARSAFAHVVVMIDAGLMTTPAEEMVDIDVARIEEGKVEASDAWSRDISAEMVDDIRDLAEHTELDGWWRQNKGYVDQLRGPDRTRVLDALRQRRSAVNGGGRLARVMEGE